MKREQVKNRFKRWLRSNSLSCFLTRFLLLSLLIFAGWIYLGRFYLHLVQLVVKLVLMPFGYLISVGGEADLIVVKSGLKLGLDLADSYLINFNLAPLFALILATSAPWKKRAKALLIGLTLMLTLHALDLALHVSYFATGSMLAKTIKDSLVIFIMIVPLAVWFYFFPAAIADMLQDLKLNLGKEKGKSKKD